MTRKIPLLALGFGMALASAQAFAHGNHSHGPALTEVERQASEGIFADKDVQDRALSDWEGVWQSVNRICSTATSIRCWSRRRKSPAARAWRSIAPIIRRATPPMWSRLALKMT